MNELKRLISDVISYHHASLISPFRLLEKSLPLPKILPPPAPNHKASAPTQVIKNPIEKKSDVKDSGHKEMVPTPVRDHPLPLSAPSKESMLALIHRLSSKTPLLTPTPPILLSLSPLGENESVFAEKVVASLSSCIAPAEICSVDDLLSLIDSLTLKLVIAPLKILETTFSIPGKEKYHQIIGKKKNVLCFSLFDIKQYLHQVDLKRSLWNSLKLLKI